MTIGDKCPEVQKKCASQGVLVNCAADGNLRLVPPLVISDAEIDPRGRSDQWSTWLGPAIKKKSGYVLCQKKRRISPASTASVRLPGLPAMKTPSHSPPAALAAAEEVLRTVNRYPDERVNVLMNALRAYYGDLSFCHRRRNGRCDRDYHPHTCRAQ